MGSNDEAAAAIEALDNKHVWQGMEAPMVVKWMDAALQKRRREEHLAAMRQGLVPSMGESSSLFGWLCCARHAQVHERWQPHKEHAGDLRAIAEAAHCEHGQ